MAVSGNLVTHAECGPPWSAVGCGSVVELVDQACRRTPDVPAMIFEDGLVVTRQQIREQVERFGGYLARRTAPGDRVAVMLETRAESMIAQLAALAARCIVVPINPTAGTHDAGHVLQDSGAVIVIAAAPTADLIESLRSGLPALKHVILVGESETDPLAAYGTNMERLRLADCTAARTDLATIHYTSGTTGMPKGCMLAHDWWLRLCDVHLRMTPHRQDDRLLCCIPFYYPDSLFLLLSLLQAGGSLVVMRRFSVSRFWPVVEEHRVTLLYLIASMPILLLKQSPGPRERRHQLRSAVCLGVPANLHSQLLERFGVPFVDTYGSTEAGWVTRIPGDQAATRIGSGSIGVAAPEVELRVVDDGDHDVAVGEAGELLLRGPGLFIGYLNQPAATADAMRGGWYHTGDLVRADDRGILLLSRPQEGHGPPRRREHRGRRGRGGPARASENTGRRRDRRSRRDPRRRGEGLCAAGGALHRRRPAARGDRRPLRRPPRRVQGAALHRVSHDDISAHADHARAEGGVEGRRRPDGERLGPRARLLASDASQDAATAASMMR